MNLSHYKSIRAAVIAAGYEYDIVWSQNVEEPVTPEAFAGEAIWVILCSGMKAQVARIISERVWAAIREGVSVITVFRHEGKAAAIEHIWQNRVSLFAALQATDDKVEWCRSLPWIGNITKWHLAKNLGVDCAKPDVHLERVAAHYDTTPAGLCAALAVSSGDRVATVDYVIWRACNLGIIRSRDLGKRSIDA